MTVLKIDVTKIDKSLFFVAQSGAKYMDCALHENRDGADKHGYLGFITQSVSKEARERNERGPIIGNWKEVGTKKPAAKTPPPAKRPPVDPDLDAAESDIPFN